MIEFSKYIYKTNCIVLESKGSTKQMETHLTHLEDLAIEKGRKGFDEFVSTVDLFVKKVQGQDSQVEINAKIDGAPALLFGRDPRERYKSQFFISLKYAFDPLKGEIRENAKVIHSERDVHDFYGDRPSFASKLSTLFKELNRAYDNSGNIYQCDVLYAGAEDKKIGNIDGEDYIMFKPNVIVYAIPVDPSSKLYNLVNSSEVGVVIHDSFAGSEDGNNIKLRQKSRKVESMIKSGQRAKVFVLGSNFSQANVDVDQDTIIKINTLLARCVELIPLISDGFDSQYVGSQVMEYLKIYINKQVDLPKGGIFGKTMTQESLKKFLAGFKKFIENRLAVLIGKKKTARGRMSQKAKLDGLLDFLNTHRESLLALLTLFSLMIEIKKVILQITAGLKDDLRHTFYQTPDGVFVPTKGEGHVLFNKSTHVKIVDRLDFTKINRKMGGQRA